MLIYYLLNCFCHASYSVAASAGINLINYWLCHHDLLQRYNSLNL